MTKAERQQAAMQRKQAKETAKAERAKARTLKAALKEQERADKAALREQAIRMKAALKEQAEDTAFRRKTGNIYGGQVRRAKEKKQEVMYSLAVLRSVCRPIVEAGLPCPYTGKPIQLKTMAIDHAQPISRGGGFTLENSVVCTKAGNERKGPLTDWEFWVLRTAVERMEDADTQAYIWGKMRQPSKHFGGAK